MKLMKYFMLLVAALGVLSACESDLEKLQTLPDSEVVAPMLHPLEVSEVNITPDNKSAKFIVKWDVANFGEGILFATDICLSYNNVEIPVITGLDTKKSSYEITYSQIYTIVSTTVEKGGLGVAADTSVDVKLRIGSTVGATGATLYSEYATIKLSHTNKTVDDDTTTDGDDTTTDGDDTTTDGDDTTTDGDDTTTDGDDTTTDGDDTTTDGDDTTTDGDDTTTDGDDTTTDGDDTTTDGDDTTTDGDDTTTDGDDTTTDGDDTETNGNTEA